MIIKRTQQKRFPVFCLICCLTCLFCFIGSISAFAFQTATPSDADKIRITKIQNEDDGSIVDLGELNEEKLNMLKQMLVNTAKEVKDVVVDNKKEHLTNFSDANNTLFENKKAEPQKTKPAEKTLGMALIEETYKLNPKEKAKQYNIHQMVQQIRDTIQTLQRMGAKIDTDEMDFENQYQMVIRIDKNSIN